MMAVSYKRLFHLLIEKEMTTAQLMHQAGFSANIITRLKRNEYVSMESLEHICRVMSCGVDDILDFVYETGEQNEIH
jgi:DNA-binding Xre family transcriptional regulator